MNRSAEALETLAALLRQKDLSPTRDQEMEADIDRSLRQLIAECERNGIDWQAIAGIPSEIRDEWPTQ